MARYELSDAEWDLIRGFFPVPVSRRGRPWADHRVVLNGIFWILRSGAAWRDLPERYGHWKTIYNRFRRLCTDGTIDAILTALQVRLNAEGRIDWELGCVDGTNIRASKSAAGASVKKLVTIRIRPLGEAGEDGEASSTC